MAPVALNCAPWFTCAVVLPLLVTMVTAPAAAKFSTATPTPVVWAFTLSVWVAVSERVWLAPLVPAVTCALAPITASVPPTRWLVATV